MLAPYVPPDLEEAAEQWGANCGPGAIAALVERPLAIVLSAMPDFIDRGYTNPTHATRALDALGWNHARRDRFEGHGLAFVQWCGPWDIGANARWAYRHTHWLAYHECGNGEVAVYDVNNGQGGGWCWYDQWVAELAPHLLPKRATGHRIRQYIGAWPVGAESAP